jgi:hypothetical protein
VKVPCAQVSEMCETRCATCLDCPVGVNSPSRSSTLGTRLGKPLGSGHKVTCSRRSSSRPALTEARTTQPPVCFAVVRTLTGHRSNCVAVDFHPFGEFFASVSFLGDVNISLGDAYISLGDAKSSLGDAKSSLGDAKS